MSTRIDITDSVVAELHAEVLKHGARPMKDAVRRDARRAAA